MKNKLIIVFLVLLMTVVTVSAADVSVNDYDPKPAEAGKPVNVWFKVENSLNDAERNVSIRITPKDGLRLTPGETAVKKIGVLSGRSSQTVQFRMLVNDDAFEGTHYMEAVIVKPQGEVKRDLSIEITDKDLKEVDLSIGDIESDPVSIKPFDENVKLQVIIQNLGDGKARGVKAELYDLPEGVTLSESYSGTSLLGNIEADGTSSATFYIDVDETTLPRQHEASLKLSYKYKPDEDEDDYLMEEKVLPIEIAIKPIPIYEIVSTKLEPQILTAGDQDVTLTVTIKNIGEEKGKSVRIKAYGKTEQPFDFDQATDFIAPTLEPGEEGQGTIKFDVKEEASLQKYFMDFEVKNVVNDDVITYDKKVNVVVTNPLPDNPWNFTAIGMGLVVIAIIYVVYTKVFKKKKEHKPKKLLNKKNKDYLKKEK